MATTFNNSSSAYQELSDGNPVGSNWGRANTELIGFYGYATPVAQRAYSSAVHATSALATSTDFGATQLAALQEIQKTLIGLGIWATA